MPWCSCHNASCLRQWVTIDLMRGFDAKQENCGVPLGVVAKMTPRHPKPKYFFFARTLFLTVSPTPTLLSQGSPSASPISNIVRSSRSLYRLKTAMCFSCARPFILFSSLRAKNSMSEMTSFISLAEPWCLSLVLVSFRHTIFSPWVVFLTWCFSVWFMMFPCHLPWLRLFEECL